ncbi:hypothetical protein [Gordoniibacillus kamchatkensis]|uniref:hypothetical protein n=1 Tax=Gordoniibacillus kamchatkensis TaxID=1590651 RepID=UPI000AB9A1D8
MFTKWWTERSYPNSRMKPLLTIGMSAALLLASGCSLLPKEQEEEQLPAINPPKLSQKPTYDVKTQTLETKVRGSGKLMARPKRSCILPKRTTASGSRRCPSKSATMSKRASLSPSLTWTIWRLS